MPQASRAPRTVMMGHDHPMVHCRISISLGFMIVTSFTAFLLLYYTIVPVPPGSPIYRALWDVLILSSLLLHVLRLLVYSKQGVMRGPQSSAPEDQ